MSDTEVGLADLLRALDADPRPEVRPVIAALLGFHVMPSVGGRRTSGATIAPGVSPTPPDGPAPRSPDRPLEADLAPLARVSHQPVVADGVTTGVDVLPMESGPKRASTHPGWRALLPASTARSEVIRRASHRLPCRQRVDVQRLVMLIARGETVRRAPLLSAQRLWERVCLVVDVSDAMVPFGRDAVVVRHQLQLLLPAEPPLDVREVVGDPREVFGDPELDPQGPPRDTLVLAVTELEPLAPTRT